MRQAPVLELLLVHAVVERLLLRDDGLHPLELLRHLPAGHRGGARG